MTICFVSPLPEQPKPSAKRWNTFTYTYVYKAARQKPPFGLCFILLYAFSLLSLLLLLFFCFCFLFFYRRAFFAVVVRRREKRSEETRKRETIKRTRLPSLLLCYTGATAGSLVLRNTCSCFGSICGLLLLFKAPPIGFCNHHIFFCFSLRLLCRRQRSRTEQLRPFSPAANSNYNPDNDVKDHQNTQSTARIGVNQKRKYQHFGAYWISWWLFIHLWGLLYTTLNKITTKTC